MGQKPPPDSGDNGTTCLRYTDDKSDKFWEVTVAGTSVTTRWGRTGSAGQSKAKSFATADLAAANAKKQTLGKLKKGYVEQEDEREREFSSDKIEEFPGLTVTLDDKKRFFAVLQLTRAKSEAKLVIFKEKPFDAEPINRTIDQLIERQEELLGELRKNGYTDYRANRAYILEDWDIEDPAQQMPSLKSASEIDRVIDFSRVEISFRQGVGNLEIRCPNTWDAEHQYMVGLVDFEIVDTDCLGEGLTYP